MTKQEVGRLGTKPQIRDELLRVSFGYFLEWTFGVLDPGRDFVSNWHLDALAYEVEQAVMAPDGYQLLVTLPPRALKSMTFSVAFVAWVLEHNPKSRFMCASYGEDLAVKLARDCRKLMQHLSYRSAFPPDAARRSGRRAIASVALPDGP